MTIAIRHAWLQKHPSPAATRGEFHWYPPDDDRELRASFVERSRGVDAPAVLWQLAPGRACWARMFAATAPIDGRHYVGMVLTIAEAERATPAELLEALEVPEAAPWSEPGGAADSEAAAVAAVVVIGAAGTSEGAERRRARARRWSVREAAGAGDGDSGGDFASESGTPADRVRATAAEAASEVRRGPARGDAGAAGAAGAAEAGGAGDAGAGAAEAGAERDEGSGAAGAGAARGEGTGAARGEGAGAARGEGSGAAGAGAAGCGSAEIAAIARALLAGGDAALAEPDRAELPELIASVERWMPASVAGKTRSGAWRMGAASQAPDRVAGLIAAAWADPASRGAQAWTLLCELAAAKERSVDEISGELGAADQPAAALTNVERAALGETGDFAATLHAWGRGRLDEIASAATLPSRLADAVALRVLACLVAGRDPRAPIAEVRWHALLPAARRSVLLDAVGRRAGSLRALVEVSHA